MRVLFVDPPGYFESVSPGLGYLSASLLSKGYEVRVLDLNNYRNRIYPRLKNSLTTFKPDIVGISIHNATITISMNLIDKAKQIHPNANFMVGGPEPTINKEFFLSNKNIDLVVVGEGEHTIIEICEFLEGKKELEKIKGLLFRDHGEVKFTGTRDLITDLDSLPFPNYDYFDSVVKNSMKVNRYPLLTSRGCPYSCSFCCAHLIVGKRWRARNPWSVINELKQAKEKYHVKVVNIYDDNFTVDMKRAKKICDLIISENLGLKFRCQNGIRADRVDRDLLEKMKKSGFYKISIGIESGDPYVFSKINKGLTLQQIERAIKLIKQVGIKKVFGFFIIGLPHSTFEAEMRTISFAKNLNLDMYVWAHLTPYRGTQAYEWVRQNGRFIRKMIDTYSHLPSEPVFETSDFPKEKRYLAYLLACIKTFHYDIYPEESPYRKAPKVLIFILKYDREQLHKHLIRIPYSLLKYLKQCLQKRQ